MVAGQFEVHGCSNITVEGNIIVIDAQGPWNYEFMAIIHKNILDAVKHVDINNFAVLLHPIGESVPVNDAINTHVDFLKEGNTKAVAVNLTSEA